MKLNIDQTICSGEFCFEWIIGGYAGHTFIYMKWLRNNIESQPEMMNVQDHFICWLKKLTHIHSNMPLRQILRCRRPKTRERGETKVWNANRIKEFFWVCRLHCLRHKRDYPHTNTHCRKSIKNWASRMSHSAFPPVGTRLCILLLTFIPCGHVAWFCYIFPLAPLRLYEYTHNFRVKVILYCVLDASCWTLVRLLNRSANYIQWIGSAHICPRDH